MFLSIIIFIITLLVLVLIHELGHFLMAKKFNIKVEEFGFGIPPRLFGKKFGETLFSINLIPLGGFVRLLGEDEVDRNILTNPRSFASKKAWQRILVVVAGVVMNLILAWVLFYSTIISQNFKVIYPTLEKGVFIGRVEKGFPAQQAGIKIGDRILKVDDKAVNNFEEARNLIKSKGGDQVTLTLSDSDGKNFRIINVTPQKVEKDDPSTPLGTSFLIGVVFSPIPFKQYSTITQKIFSGITYSYDLTRLTFMGLGKTLNDLFYGHIETVSQSVTGPVGLAGMTNNILSGGKQAISLYLWFVGVISLTLSIFNILPIPALDGGRLLFLVIEAFTKKKVKAEIERVVHQIGFALLLTLAILITYSDIKKMFP